MSLQGDLCENATPLPCFVGWRSSSSSDPTLHQFSHAPMPAGIMGQFASALSTSHYIYAVAFFQVVPAVLLFLTAIVPLGLTLLPGDRQHLPGPHSHGPKRTAIAALVVVLWLLVFYRVRSAFAGSLSGVCRTRPDRQSGLFSTIKAVMIQYLYLGRVLRRRPSLQAELVRSPPPGPCRTTSCSFLSTRPCSPLAANATVPTYWRRMSCWASRGVTLTRSTAAATSPTTAPDSSSATHLRPPQPPQPQQRLPPRSRRLRPPHGRGPHPRLRRLRRPRAASAVLPASGALDRRLPRPELCLNGEKTTPAGERKIGAIGIHVSAGHSHGFAST